MKRVALIFLFAFAACDLSGAPGKGVLVLQTGSDWCVSGERVRKSFESSEFRSGIGSGWELLVYDDMDSPTDEVKAKNAKIKDFVVRTKRFPAITCYSTDGKRRVFAQIENIPIGITPEKLALVIGRAVARKNKAQSLFEKAKSAKDESAADMYGQGFRLLASMMGPFHFNELTKGKSAWSDEWNALASLDTDDKYGWVI